MQIIRGKDYTINELINLCTKALDEGLVMVLPTDTVYGLCVDATNHSAVQKLITFKERPLGKAISCFVLKDDIGNYVKIHNKSALIENLLPGPYTLIFESKHKIDHLLESETGTLGIRYPKNDFIQELLKRYKKPITATSANITNLPSNYSIKSLLKTLNRMKSEEIDIIIDIGDLPHNKPSTVIDFTKSDPEILRKADDKDLLKTFVSNSVLDTKKIAKETLDLLCKNQRLTASVILLHGELGSGKTTFTKAIAEELKVQDVVTSPTFVTTYEYKTHNTNYPFTILHHFDLYNIENIQELNLFDLPKLLKNPNNLLIIEWSEKAKGQLNNNATHIFIDILKESRRKFSVYI